MKKKNKSLTIVHRPSCIFFSKNKNKLKPTPPRTWFKFQKTDPPNLSKPCSPFNNFNRLVVTWQIGKTRKLACLKLSNVIFFQLHKSTKRVLLLCLSFPCSRLCYFLLPSSCILPSLPDPCFPPAFQPPPNPFAEAFVAR